MIDSFDPDALRRGLAKSLARTLITTATLAVLFLPAGAHAANPDAGRWKAQGGQLLFSGTHEFKRNWWTHQSVRGELYWTDGEDQRVDRPTHPWEPEVRDSVRIPQGRFTVRGPGQIVAYVRQIQDKPELKVTTGAGSTTAGPFDSGSSETFEPATRPGEQLSGWVLSGRTYHFDVALEQAVRLNPATGYRLYQAPQAIEFELWFFARPGGRVVDLRGGGQPSGSSSGGGLFGSADRVGAVGWVRCARAGGRLSGATFDALVECGGKGPWLLDSRGNRVRRLAPSEGVSGGQILETDSEAWTRLSLDDKGGAQITMHPGTRIGFQEGDQEGSHSLALFHGRLLVADDLRREQSLFEADRLEIETLNARVGASSDGSADDRDDDSEAAAEDSPADGVIYEVLYDERSRSTAVVTAGGFAVMACKARPDAVRRVYEGDRAQMSDDCRVGFDFPAADDVAALERLAAYGSSQATGPSGQAGGGTAGTYLGCYRDSDGTAGRDLDGERLFPRGLTPQICVAECAERGYAFAGVQWGRSCYCGKSYGRYGESDACNSRCAGDSSQTCGGYAANGVYATGIGGPGTAKPPLGPAPAGVTLYVHSDFEGRSETFVRDVPSLARTRIGNDEAGSVRVGLGCRAMLFEHSDFRGVSIEVTGDVPVLAETPLGNDRAGSLRVACD